MDRAQEIARTWAKERSFGLTGWTHHEDKLAQDIRDEVQGAVSACHDLVLLERECAQARLEGAVQRERERCLLFVREYGELAATFIKSGAPYPPDEESGAEPPEGER